MPCSALPVLIVFLKDAASHGRIVCSLSPVNCQKRCSEKCLCEGYVFCWSTCDVIMFFSPDNQQRQQCREAVCSLQASCVSD